jgi:predicted nucleic acid-binding protein
MRFLLDTNILSEVFKRAPEPRVVTWLSQQMQLDLYISVLTIGELTMGIELGVPSPRRDALQTWATQELPQRFAGRLLPITEAVAREWGRMSAHGRATGRELPVSDGLLLATARTHDLTFVTRNERDCADRDTRILNPWR